MCDITPPCDITHIIMQIWSHLCLAATGTMSYVAMAELLKRYVFIIQL